jgi:beta-lactamase superfamily II metal-dependent hydrolase
MAKPNVKGITTAAILLSVVTAITISTRHEDIQPNSPLASNEIRVHYIDVGQGDATLIQSADNTVLIDGGDTKTQKKFINYLRSTGITSIDYVIATHPHTDHIGGLSQVVQQFAVKDVLMLDTIYKSPSFKQLIVAMEAKGLKYATPAVGDTFAAGIIKFTVLAPAKKFKDLNDMSIVIRMVYGETAFLFTGDAEGLSEREMLRGELPLRSNVLKAGHHGSGSSSTSEFLDAVSPSVVVISCGKKNVYGFPDEKVLKNVLKPERNITLFRTDEDGTVVISTDGQNITLPSKKEVAHVLDNRPYRKRHSRIDKYGHARNVGSAPKRFAQRRERGTAAVY